MVRRIESTAHSVLRMYFWMDVNQGREAAEEWLKEKEKTLKREDSRKVENSLNFVDVKGHKYVGLRRTK